ncbi:hypothetical protein BH09PLA1_BH09PLA1_36630 [soil metagenome]
MDISKLPKLSDTQKEQPALAAEQNPVPVAPLAVDRPRFSESNAAEVWISLTVGAILLLMFPRFLSWVSSRLFGTHFNPFVAPDGSVVPYTQVPEFWGDLGPTLFGTVLIVEGIALMFARKRVVMMLALTLTVIATAYNLIYVITSFNPYGLANVSAFAAAFGVYIAMYQWKLIRTMSPRAVLPVQ